MVDGDWVVGLDGHRCPMTVATWNDLKQLHAGHKDTHAVRIDVRVNSYNTVFNFRFNKVLIIHGDQHKRELLVISVKYCS